MAYHRYHGVKTRIVRIFNTYGPRMRLNDGRVLPNFMGQALRGEPITVYGRGDQTRSFCYVSDLVEGIYRLLNADFSEPVNLGNPAEITVLQLAQEIIALVEGTKSTIIYEDLPQDDPKRRKPDITRAQNLLGWEPDGRSLRGPEAQPGVFPPGRLNGSYGRLAGVPPRISIAALRPLTAITLPPGCVQAPQRKTPGIGVRGVSRRSHMYGGRHSPWKMWPPTRPTSRSMSGGPSTWTSITAAGMLSQYRAIERRARSLTSSRRDSQSPRANVCGTYWAKTLIVCTPSGATLGSCAVWK